METVKSCANCKHWDDSYTDCWQKRGCSPGTAPYLGWELCDGLLPVIKEHNCVEGGFGVSYYTVQVQYPVTLKDAYTVECMDLITHLGLTYSEGNIMKALFRRAGKRRGAGKDGASLVYDREKIQAFAKALDTEDMLYDGVVQEGGNDA